MLRHVVKSKLLNSSLVNTCKVIFQKDINKMHEYNLKFVVPKVIVTSPIDGVVSRGGVCN